MRKSKEFFQCANFTGHSQCGNESEELPVVVTFTGTGPPVYGYVLNVSEMKFKRSLGSIRKFPVRITGRYTENGVTEYSGIRKAHVVGSNPTFSSENRSFDPKR
jgi:hypothetical protein